MIQPLRRAHRVLIPLLLLIVLAAAIFASLRPPASAVMSTLPTELKGSR